MNEEKLIPVPIGPKGVELKDLDGMFRFATCYLQSGLAPQSFKNAQQLVIAWAKAAELGLSPLQAVEGMSIIGNRVGIMGDLALAMVESSGLLAEKKVEYSGEGNERRCTVTLTRKGRKGTSYTFSAADARRAGLWGKAGPWSQYPDRMLYYRALGFGLRDEFPDVLKGTKTVEELQDYPDALANDEEKVRYNQQRDSEIAAHPPAGAKIVTPTGGAKPTPAEAVEPAFPADAQKPPAFAQRLGQDFPAQPPTIEEDFLRQPAAAVPTPPLPPEKKADPYQKPPPDSDELDLSSPPKTEGETEDTSWKEHVVRSVDHVKFKHRKVGALTQRELSIIENQWLPVVTEDWDNATIEQQADANAFRMAIAASKAAKPW